MFQTSVLATQTVGTAVAFGTAASLLNDDAIGACATDSMSISSPGFVGSPIICGTNTGQHSKFASCLKALVNVVIYMKKWI